MLGSAEGNEGGDAKGLMIKSPGGSARGNECGDAKGLMIKSFGGKEGCDGEG